jgi:hypothetical protein
MRGSLAKSEKSPFPPYSFSLLPVAQSDAGVGSSSVLSGQLKSGFKGPLYLLVDLRNKAAQIRLKISWTGSIRT